MEIRRAELRDIDTICTLLYQIAALHHELRPDVFLPAKKKYSDEALSATILNDDTPVFVADENGVVGYAFCIFRRYPDNGLFCDRKLLYVDDICVEEALRGRGIGKQLYAYVRAFAKEQGCDQVVLNVWAANGTAMKFYESCGMKQQRIMMEDTL